MTGPRMGLDGTRFGPWRLLRPLGSNGLGEVYLAERAEADPARGASAAPDSSPAGPAPHRQVAIKVLRPPASDPLAQSALSDSARARALHAPHVIPLDDAVQQGDRAGIVMAWVPGGSLADTLARRGPGGQPVISLPMRPATVARLITQVGRAVAEAHAAGVAHGDIKPSNIFIRRSSQGGLLAALSDFGQGGLVALAAQLIAAHSPMASEPWIQDHLLYTAPERLAGAPPNPASDQYALAAVAYYLLTGRAPITGDARTLLATIPTAEVIEPSALLPAAPADLDAILARALAKDPAQRFESVEAFVRALGASLASAAGAGGVTQEFSRLSGQRVAEAARPTGGQRRRARVDSSGLPSEPPSALWRALALATAAAVLIAVATCGVSLFALNGAGIHPRSILASFQGLNAVPTHSEAQEPPTDQAQAADQRLRTLLAQQPIFTDSLTSNQHNWQAIGGQLSFTSGGLTLTNQNSGAPAFAGASSIPGRSDYAGQVTMRFQNGNAGDLAGVRFFVTDDGAGGQEYYTFFLAPNGEYHAWYFQGAWRYLDGGYTAFMKPGVGASNTLSFVTDSAQGTVTLYVNGSYLNTIPLVVGGSTGGDAGLIILNHGVQATYSNFALYPALHN